MKIAVYYPASLWCAWSCSYGLVDALKRLGHEIIDIPVSAPVKEVPKCDGIIISGPEHIAKVLPRTEIPTVAWMHETVEREDYGKMDVELLKSYANVIFCPGIQDEKYGFVYLPFGVDTEIFHSEDSDKNIDLGFIGLMYPKRVDFIKRLQPLMNGTKITCGNVQVLELDGINSRKTVHLYAENLRRIKLFVNLPTLSQLAVTKIYEVLACGTPILTPAVSDMRNLTGLPVIAYKDSTELASLLRGKRGCLEPTINLALDMHSKHRLELRCETLVKCLENL